GEIPGVRLAYLQAVYLNAMNNMSVKATTENLDMSLNILASTKALDGGPIPVRTLVSAKRRLGIDPDSCIIQYTICTRCWKHHTPTQDTNGNTRRRALKILPQVSLIHNLRRIVRRKGFRKLVRDSRDTAENANNDPNFVMHDMHDGTMWH
ncbi:hypothetical protein F5877DRAFT_6556, partial [Lentinula edodes]